MYKCTRLYTSDMHGIMGRAFAKHVGAVENVVTIKKTACMISVSVRLFCIFGLCFRATVTIVVHEV